MGCNKVGHVHNWPTSGTLVIQRCEIRCNFCVGDDADHSFKYAWFLRRHVRAMHIRRGPYEDLEVSDDWDDAHADKRKKTRQRRKKIIQTQAPENVDRPVYAEQLWGGYIPYAVEPAALDIQATTGLGLDEILADDTGKHDYTLEDEKPSSLMPDDIFNEENVESWLDHLAEGAYDLPPLDSVDASAAHLYNTTAAAELNELEPGLSPIDSISNADEDLDALFDETEVPPFLPSPNVSDPAADTASINDDGPATPTSVLAGPDFFADATYHVDGLDFDLEDPTKFFLPNCATDFDNEPRAQAFQSTPVDDGRFKTMLILLDVVAWQMKQQGMILEQMLSCAHAFSQSLQEKMLAQEA
ncbi:hypothetical protein DOTSEDRAFT_20458 [Dothistroma septosporum NZE10]|uniref:Uncharacterized protein n=1 Tax=Dothistroma septosporum (strain NZE10 / CBS 128990) TaxID=675120 RepID=N1Q516_DOTSN|nr:hypothetical protein DOTSEDRAFT_20458 [Dothistroma septosporum NZE10]